MIRKGINYILQDAFLKNNAIFFAGSLMVAFLNYLYHPVLSRLMTVTEFGEVQTVISLFYLSGLVLSIFRMISVNIVTNDADSSSSQYLSRLYSLALFIHLPFVILVAFLSPAISHFFSFKSSWSFLPFALFILANIPFTFYNGYLQGKQKFVEVSISNIIVAGGKLFLAIILVYLGSKVFGAVTAIFLSTLAALIYTLIKSPDFRFRIVHLRHILETLKNEFKYGLLVLVSLGFITFMYSGDVLVIKRFFSPEDAGLYSGIATIGRIIYFATASIGAVLLSSIKIGNEYQAENVKILKKAIILVLLIGGAAVLIFSLFPKLIISILIGSRYASLAGLLPKISLYLFLVSISNLFISYLLALRRNILFLISLVSLGATALAIFINNGSLGAIVTDFIIGSVLSIIIAGIFYKSFRTS